MKKEFYNIAKLVTQNSKVLDVGCGNGELMKYITENISKDIIENKTESSFPGPSKKHIFFNNKLINEWIGE